MLRWSFRTYVSSTGRNDVQKTIDQYDIYSSTSLERAVLHLAVTELKGWDEPHCKKLKGEDPLYEIRYKANHRAERALGYFEDERTFVILIICYHKGRVYTPPDAIQSAHRRRRQLLSGQASTAPLQIDGEDFS